MQYGKESAEFLASVALASRLNAHCTECHIVARLHVYMSEPRSVFFFGADLTHELFCLEAEERHDAGVASCSPTRQLAHHRLEVHHSSAAKDMRVISVERGI